MSTRSKSLKPKSDASEQLNDTIIEAIFNLKGKNIVKLDLRHLNDAPVDFFIICEGDSSTQVKSISENINREVFEKMDTRPYHIEGAKEAQWVLVDYFNTVVHVFHPETRKYYELEDMWMDAKSTEYQNL